MEFRDLAQGDAKKKMRNGATGGKVVLPRNGRWCLVMKGGMWGVKILYAFTQRTPCMCVGQIVPGHRNRPVHRCVKLLLFELRPNGGHNAMTARAGRDGVDAAKV